MTTTTKLNNIQVLRAFAALSVVYYHAGYTFPHIKTFGSYGVDVFFVISGYIMARILDDRSEAHLAVKAVHVAAHPGDFFLRRRILRIVPPYWFFTLLIFAASLSLPQFMGATRPDFSELVKSLLFIPFAKYPWVIQPLLFIGWSLNYEMFFYVALAAGVLLHKRFAWRIPSVLLGAAFVLLTMLACAPFANQNVIARFYARDLSLEFLFGIVSYYLCCAVPETAARKLRPILLLICLSSALGIIALQAFTVPVPLTRALTLGLPSLLLVTSASLLSQGGWDTRLSWLVLIGDASYILYLVHPYCEYSIDRMLGQNHPWLRSQTAIGAVISIGSSLALALLIHVYAERPTVKLLNRKFGGKRRSLEFTSPAVGPAA